LEGQQGRVKVAVEEGIATKRHKKHKKIEPFCDFCAFLWLFLFVVWTLTWPWEGQEGHCSPMPTLQSGSMRGGAVHLCSQK
jgi:hypothetical protein